MDPQNFDFLSDAIVIDSDYEYTRLGRATLDENESDPYQWDMETIVCNSRHAPHPSMVGLGRLMYDRYIRIGTQPHRFTL
jgi:hypothetical protein